MQLEKDLENRQTVYSLSYNTIQYNIWYCLWFICTRVVTATVLYVMMWYMTKTGKRDFYLNFIYFRVTTEFVNCCLLVLTSCIFHSHSTAELSVANYWPSTIPILSIFVFFHRFKIPFYRRSTENCKKIQLSTFFKICASKFFVNKR